MSTPYTNMRAYLADYFALLATRLHCEVVRARLLRAPGTDEAFLGLFLSDEEIERVLQGLHGAHLAHDGRTMGLEERACELSARIASRLAVTVSPLRTARLAELFDLSPAALEVVLLLLAPEVDSRFARVYACLQDDVGRRWPSPGLVLRLLPGAAADDPSSRGLFAAESPLVRHELIHVGTGGELVPAPLVDRPLKLDDRIVEYLLEHDPLDPALEGLAELDDQSGDLAADVGQSLAHLPVDAGLAAQLAHLVALWQAAPGPAAFFWGREGSGKSAAAAAVARSLGRPLLTVDTALLALQPAQEIDGRLRRAAREALLRGAILHIRHGDALDASGRTAVHHLLGPGVILSAHSAWPLHSLPHPPVTVHFPVPGFALRRQLWQSALPGKDGGNGQLPIELAGRFQLTPEQIARAAAVAQGRAWLRDGPEALPAESDLFDGCRQQSNPNLAALAAKVNSPHTWDDLVLPEAQMGLLRAIEGQVRHAHTVYERWGFDRKLVTGRGLNTLFSGPSGTGKTMAAAILARSLGLDMYKIDLSGVVSKYIGETEKNLSRIFEEAASANAILFFDEADALFGKRSEVKDAHDRYANIEISYLLQKMEEYAGVTILATNFSQNLDEAFTRRMHFVVDFPLPTAADRERIWRGLFPAEAPRATDIDFAFLSQRFELAGGNIRNCVLTAAFLAAEEGADIGMGHLVQGVAREFAKMGRPLQKSVFASYFAAARQGRRG